MVKFKQQWIMTDDSERAERLAVQTGSHISGKSLWVLCPRKTVNDLEQLTHWLLNIYVWPCNLEKLYHIQRSAQTWAWGVIFLLKPFQFCPAPNLEHDLQYFYVSCFVSFGPQMKRFFWTFLPILVCCQQWGCRISFWNESQEDSSQPSLK